MGKETSSRVLSPKSTSMKTLPTSPDTVSSSALAATSPPLDSR